MTKNEQKILKTAFDLFSERGYKGSPTRVIAEKAGVNELTLFRYFKNKSNLLQCVINHFNSDGNVVELFASKLSDDLGESYELIPKVYCQHLRDNYKLFKIQVREVEENYEKFSNSRMIKDYIVDYLNNHKDFSGDAEAKAVFLLSLGMGYFMFETFSDRIVEKTDLEKVLSSIKY